MVSWFATRSVSPLLQNMKAAIVVATHSSLISAADIFPVRCFLKVPKNTSQLPQLRCYVQTMLNLCEFHCRFKANASKSFFTLAMVIKGEFLYVKDKALAQSLLKMFSEILILLEPRVKCGCDSRSRVPLRRRWEQRRLA